MCINAEDVETDTSPCLSKGQSRIRLDLFRILPTDLSTVKYRYVKIPPQTSSITPIQVYVERQSDPIYLSRSFSNWIWVSKPQKMPISQHVHTM